MVSVPQRRFGRSGWSPSCGRGLWRPWTRWGANNPLGAAAPGPARLPGAVLAAEPGREPGWVALTSEGRGTENQADQRSKVVVTDRGDRSRAGRTLGWRRAYTVERRRAEHAAHHGHRQLVFRGYLGAFAGADRQLPFSPPPQDLFYGQLPDLPLGLRNARSRTGPAAGPSAPPAALQEVVASRQPAPYPKFPRQRLERLAT